MIRVSSNTGSDGSRLRQRRVLRSIQSNSSTRARLPSASGSAAPEAGSTLAMPRNSNGCPEARRKILSPPFQSPVKTIVWRSRTCSRPSASSRASTSRASQRSCRCAAAGAGTKPKSNPSSHAAAASRPAAPQTFLAFIPALRSHGPATGSGARRRRLGEDAAGQRPGVPGVHPPRQPHQRRPGWPIAGRARQAEEHRDRSPLRLRGPRQAYPSRRSAARARARRENR